MLDTSTQIKGMFIGGSWVASGPTFEDINTSTGAVWANVPEGGRLEARKAISAAQAAFPAWAALHFQDRAKILLKAADVWEARKMDYVAAAQTRGEGSWYIMLWEILPNARGPLIVDFCLRIGYTTILLGTLGFFGLGLPPESPDWGSTINEGRKLLLIVAHPALPPAIALLSLVLGLNLLADGLREESLKD